MGAQSKKVDFFKKIFLIKKFPNFSLLEGNGIFFIKFWTLKNDKSLSYWAENDPNHHF